MNDETKKQSVFMQMHNGTLTGQGSFHVALKELFYKADNSNKRKLVGAFPEFFGDEVPEFGITKRVYTVRPITINIESLAKKLTIVTGEEPGKTKEELEKFTMDYFLRILRQIDPD